MSTAEQKIAMPALRAGARPMAIIPQSFEDVQRIATMAVRSELFKKAKDNEADETTIARCALAIMTGLDCGLSPAQSVQSIAVINGRCLIYGDAVPGILWANGFDIEQSISGEGDSRMATCTITRPGGKKITRTFSVAEAKKARLWDERPTVKKKWGDKWEDKPNDSPWFRFSDRMLGWRALGFAKSDGASDVMRGLDIRENLEPVDLNRDEYSEIKVAPKKAIAALPDIPDEPAKEADAPQPQADTAQEKKPDNKPATTDADYLEELAALFAATRDMDSLNEVLVHNEMETEDRGLQQAVRDIYEKHRTRIYDQMT